MVGEKGIIKTSTFTYEPIVLENSRGRQEFPNERPENIQFYLIEQIVRALSGNGEVVSTGISAARTSWVMDQVVKEYYKNRCKVRQGCGESALVLRMQHSNSN